MELINFEWITEHELQKLVNLKRTSLYLLRRSGKLRFSKIGRRIYYDLISVKETLNMNASSIKPSNRNDK